MTSLGPYTEAHNNTHMFDIPDLRGNVKQEFYPTSLMGIIDTHQDFTKFKYMVQLAKLEYILNDPQADFTLFVPSDTALKDIEEGIFINMDIAVARHIVKSSMMDRKIPSEILKDVPVAYFITKDSPNKLLISNISDKTYINTDINIIDFDMEASNGIIHVTDKLIFPHII